MTFYRKKFYKKILKYIPFIIISIIQLNYLSISAFEKRKSIESDSKEIIKENNLDNEYFLKSEYLLDGGDSLFIDFKGLEIFSKKYNVNFDGNIILPEIDRLNVRGKTIEELEKEINLAYEEYIIDPEIKIYILKYRPVNVYISGEVKRPGLYKINYFGNLNDNGNSNDNDNTVSSDSAPKLYKSLQIAEGVTSTADLSKIQIIRHNSKTQGGGKIKANINLLALILEGDQSQNIRIYDGDNIIVPKSKQIIKEQILTINKTNLSPNIITIFISGNVIEPGPITLKKGSSLIQAIASSGGKKLMSGKINFIRFNDDGTITKNNFKYNEKALINSSTNPILRDGDVINVQKTLLGKTTEVLNEVSSPILSGFGLYNLFNE